jgi:signal transduction histidine kinase
MNTFENKETQVRALYAKEARQLEELEDLLRHGEIESAASRAALAAAVKAHQALIQQVVKLTLVSDSLQAKLKQAERELQRTVEHAGRLNKNLQQLNQKKDEVLAFAAHDLRSPLAGIQGLAEMLASEDLAESGESREVAREIAGAAKEILEMISHMLGVYRGAGEISDPGWRELSLQDMLDRCAAAHRLSARSKQVTLSLEAETPDAMVKLEWELVTRVWQNLLGNAIKFTPPGGSVFVRLRLVEERWLEFTIQDTGPGISPDDRAMLFRKFGRLSAPPTSGETSQGLGLKIAFRIVEHLGGTISCSENQDSGAEFVVLIPVQCAPSASPREPILSAS